MTEQGDPAETGTYLYAVGAAAAGGRDHADRRRKLDGVLGTPVRVLTEAESELAAYVSTVPLTEFGEEALRRNLEDLTWLEAIARGHHQVLATLMDAGPVLPVRLVTVYRGDRHVREMLRDRAGEFADLLVRISGRREWGVKVYAVGQGAAERPASTDHADTADTADTPDTFDTADTATHGPGTRRGAARRRAGEATERPGTAYLRSRGRSLRGREAAWRHAVSRAEHVDAVLSRIAVATRHHRAQDPRLSGRSDLMVLNGAYLVDDGHADDFAAAAAELREADLEVQLTGPWPPYSFTISDAGPGGDVRRAAGDPP